ncbi:restriction endonuclease subunit S [Microbacterium aerolatum]|uniref:restriction endonuclease subunit S n=1 Tax=Microbacterium aerolatum TaxID=153731 RepID=UPI00384BA894
MVESRARVPMGSVGEFIRGRRFTKNDMVDEGIPSIHYGEIYTRYGVSTRQTVSFVRTELRPQLRFAIPGDVVIAAVGETVEDVGKGVAWLGDTEVAIHDDCFLFRSEVLNPRYVAHYLRTDVLIREKDQYVARAKVKRLSGDNLARLLIPVPPLPEQQKIVATLDSYSAKLTDLSAALEAELDAREKQYHFYRGRMFESGVTV